jgi:hypothetical protein
MSRLSLYFPLSLEGSARNGKDLNFSSHSIPSLLLSSSIIFHISINHEPSDTRV